MYLIQVTEIVQRYVDPLYLYFFFFRLLIHYGHIHSPNPTAFGRPFCFVRLPQFLQFLPSICHSPEPAYGLPDTCGVLDASIIDVSTLQSRPSLLQAISLVNRSWRSRVRSGVHDDACWVNGLIKQVVRMTGSTPIPSCRCLSFIIMSLYGLLFVLVVASGQRTRITVAQDGSGDYKTIKVSKRDSWSIPLK